MRSKLAVLAVAFIGIGSIGAKAGVSSAESPMAAPRPEPVVAPDTARDEPVAAALSALADAVKEQSHPDALHLALEAYYNFAAAHPDRIRNPYFYFVDFGLDNATARGYVFDMKSLKLVEGPFTVAHGRGSSSGRNGVPTRFSNRPGSYATALGLYVAQETYTFTGKSGGRRYSSTGLRLAGESGRFNDTARARGIVAHGAPYVTANASGRSEGCPAMEMDRARRLLPLIANGGVVFLYSPRDREWLSGDPWIAEYVAARNLAGRNAAGG